MGGRRELEIPITKLQEETEEMDGRGGMWVIQRSNRFYSYGMSPRVMSRTINLVISHHL